MENNELLKSISDMMDTKLKPIKEDIQSLKQGQEDIKKHITNNNINLKQNIIK